MEQKPNAPDTTRLLDTDTIAAVATAAGMGGIGIVRLSGSSSLTIAEQLSGKPLTPRQAHFRKFYAYLDESKQLLDSGIALFFPAPNSFTGEDVVELQIHGGPIVLDSVLSEAIRLGARQARAGEFSERAFLNNKIDLVQAEAIADLINSGSEQEARGALKSLHGEFSSLLNELADQLMRARIFVEAALDFPEEEIDFLNDQQLHTSLEHLKTTLSNAVKTTRQGTLLKEGISVAIAGRPNAGKSSLLNALAGTDAAIVTDIAGTTRDVLRQHIHIDGLAIHLIDTAGLRATTNTIEREGIKRAGAEFDKADLILLIVDAQTATANNEEDTVQSLWPGEPPSDITLARTLIIYNKIDLLSAERANYLQELTQHCVISAKTGVGTDRLKTTIKKHVGYSGADASPFTARRRHLDALRRALALIEQGHQQLKSTGAGELLAEDLRQAQYCLDDITGKVSSDALLGEIFSNFCIGK
ncbi:MAG: tRNA uridine-5-carboxymethylaminomethyl(34) synthesis GTPase MnmE [Pseudomonadales bacterium]